MTPDHAAAPQPAEPIPNAALEELLQSFNSDCDALETETRELHQAFAALVADLKQSQQAANEAAETLGEEIVTLNAEVVARVAKLHDAGTRLKEEAETAAQQIDEAADQLRQASSDVSAALDERVTDAQTNVEMLGQSFGEQLAVAARLAADELPMLATQHLTPLAEAGKSRLDLLTSDVAARLGLVDASVTELMQDAAAVRDDVYDFLGGQVATEAEALTTALRQQVEGIAGSALATALQGMSSDLETTLHASVRALLQQILSDIERRLQLLTDEMVRTGDGVGSRRVLLESVVRELEAVVGPVQDALDHIQDINRVIGSPI